MENPTLLLHLVFLLIAARLAGEAAALLKIPSVIGELLAGIVIGPSLFNLVPMSAPLQLLAQIGVILLLFEVGLETDVSRLTQAGRQALSVASLGIILPFCLGFSLSYWLFHLSLLVSIFIASTLTATSIGITLRVLQDLGKQKTHEAHIVIGAAVLDDIVGIVLLSLLYEFATSGAFNLLGACKVFICITLFLLIAPLAAQIIGKIIKMWEKKSEIPGLLPTTVVSLILFFAWIAHSLGAPELLGGFAAGIALSKQPYAPFGTTFSSPVDFIQRVEKAMHPIIHLFSPIFFVAIGLEINFRQIPVDQPFVWIFSIAITIAAIIGKFCSGLLLKKETMQTKIIVGLAMIPRGEVGLIFATIGRTTAILTQELYACIIVVVAITTFIAPFALRMAFSKK